MARARCLRRKRCTIIDTFHRRVRSGSTHYLVRYSTPYQAVVSVQRCSPLVTAENDSASPSWMFFRPCHLPLRPSGRRRTAGVVSCNRWLARRLTQTLSTHTDSSIGVSCSSVLQRKSRVVSTTWVVRQCEVGMKKLIGYARVSTRSQQADRQIEDLVTAGVRRDDLYVDHGVSGARTSRPGFDQALAALQPGDTLVIATLDRLGRSTQSMLTFAQQLRGRGAGLRVLNLCGGDVEIGRAHV